MKYSKATENQLDIMDEAITLINAARTETYNLAFEQALQIVKTHYKHSFYFSEKVETRKYEKKVLINL